MLNDNLFAGDIHSGQKPRDRAIAHAYVLNARPSCKTNPVPDPFVKLLGCSEHVFVSLALNADVEIVADLF
jgi:hypothetical protein